MVTMSRVFHSSPRETQGALERGMLMSAEFGEASVSSSPPPSPQAKHFPAAVVAFAKSPTQQPFPLAPLRGATYLDPKAMMPACVTVTRFSSLLPCWTRTGPLRLTNSEDFLSPSKPLDPPLIPLEVKFTLLGGCRVSTAWAGTSDEATCKAFSKNATC